MYGGREWNVPSRFLAEIPVELTDAAEQPSARAVAGTWSRQPETSWSSGGGTVAADAPAPSASFAMGDDVTHAKFGDGVVVGKEPGGLVVVRFADGGDERKLMADFAPLKKR